MIINVFLKRFKVIYALLAGIAMGYCLNGHVLADNGEKAKPEAIYSNPYFKGTEEEKRLQINRMTELLGVDCAYCHNEDLTVFTEAGEKSKEMMDASVALEVECDYCHIDLDHYKENEQQVRRMFELSETMGTDCSFCHAGKDKLTPKGERSKTAFLTRAWATKGTKQCLECHIEKKQFALNFYGWQVLNAMKGLRGM